LLFVPRYLPSNSIVALRRAFGAFCCVISDFGIEDHWQAAPEYLALPTFYCRYVI